MRNYEDIRNHECYQLKHHTPMSLESRAAQFAPFAALVTVTYFQPDAKKDGGRYMTYTGNFRFYDAEKRVMKFVDGMVIGVELVCRIEMK